MNIKEANTFPEISRSGRTSEELQKIIDALVSSSETGKPFNIENVEMGKKYNSLQQRIRAQAKKLNLRVQIHLETRTNTLFFRVVSQNEVSVKSKNVKGVKTIDKM
jgi:hypothetical protein